MPSAKKAGREVCTFQLSIFWGIWFCIVDEYPQTWITGVPAIGKK